LSVVGAKCNTVLFGAMLPTPKLTAGFAVPVFVIIVAHALPRAGGAGSTLCRPPVPGRAVRTFVEGVAVDALNVAPRTARTRLLRVQILVQSSY
jgi:hypothetical protein